MICHRCLLRAAARHNATHTPHRAFFSSSSRTLATKPVPADVTTATNPRPNNLPAATSTSAAQPFSEALTYSPARLEDLPIHRAQSKQPVVRAPSSVPAGTVLKGLNFMKGGLDPVAGEDGSYPDWLWGVLEKRGVEGEGEGGGEVEGDLFSKSKKQRRKAAKALRKQQLLHPELLQPKVPLYEQSIDLPSGDGTIEGAMEAGESRQELTKAMRGNRRAKIKEDNFLKAMR